MRSFEEGERVCYPSSILEPAFSVFRPSWWKPEHSQRNHWKPTGHHGGERSRGTGYGLDPDPGLPARVYELDPGIRDTRCSGVRHKGQVLAVGQFLEKLWEPALEVMGVETDGRRGDPEVTQQLSCMTGILGGNEVRLAQNTQASEGHVFEIADGSRDHGQNAGHRQKT